MWPSKIYLSRCVLVWKLKKGSMWDQNSNAPLISKKVRDAIEVICA
jgi:hypothetical protein